MKGIVLAGGTGTRLHPVTRAISKQLLPVYDKPMIYYPMSVLMLAGITDLLVITTPAEQGLFRDLLGDGSQWGICISYAVQPAPDGIAQALLIGEHHIAGDCVALILGDNIFFGHGLPEQLGRAVSATERLGGCTVFGYRVNDPERYGVAVLDYNGKLTSVEEKPKSPTSNLAVTGLYFYDRDAIARAKRLVPSARGELEITDLNMSYIRSGTARLVDLGRGTAWLDTGTTDSLLAAGQFVQVLQQRQGVTIACLEEIAMRRGYITPEAALRASDQMAKSSYGAHLRRAALEFAGSTT